MATPILTTLDEIAGRYDAVFCDLWGCLHNGITPYPAAMAALARFGAMGGAVLLLTNSPRTAPGVMAQLDEFGVPRSLYHAVASSGDAAFAALAAGEFGGRVHHVGPERDLGFYEGLGVDLVPLDAAEGIVCTGLFDETRETPDDYRALILEGVARGLPFLCANPDIYVDRGEVRFWCAGAIAAAYAEAGGDARYFGKPHAPVYEVARRRLAALGRDIPDDRILCIGDGIATDIAGGVGEGFDTLFVTGGLAAATCGPDPENPDPALLEGFLRQHRLSPTAAIGRLR